MSFVTPIENSSVIILRVCFQSFIKSTKLKILFEDGCRIMFSCSSETMSTNLDVHNIKKPIRENNFNKFYRRSSSQFKVKLLKGGGHLAYRRHKFFAYKK